MGSSFFGIAIVQYTLGIALAQFNPQQAEQQHRVETWQREVLEQAQRRIARAQADQQREIEESAEQRRRAELNVARTLETERREEERRALILRQQKAQLHQNQPADAAAASPAASQEARGSPASSDSAESEFHAPPWRFIGVGLMSCGILLALGRLIYLRLFNQSDA